MLKRLQIVMMLLAVGILTVLLASPTPARSISHVVADTMTADSAETWKTLLNDKDFETILKAQLAEIEKGTKSSGIFNRNIPKVRRAAGIIAILGNAGTLTRTGDDAKKSAALRDAALAVNAAAKAKKFAEVKTAAATLLTYPATIAPAAEGTPIKWDKVISLDSLMKCVSNIDNEQVTSNKKDKAGFAKDAKDRAADTVLLACLAVVAREHKEAGAAKAGKQPADATDWLKWCDSMRSDATELSKQYASKNQAGAAKAYAQLQKSCTDCHEVYRKDEN